MVGADLLCLTKRKVRNDELMEELNSLSLERLRYVCDYSNLTVQLENHLSSVRSGISKARTLRGVALSTVFNIDAQTLEPTSRIEYDSEKFTLVDQSLSSYNEEENSGGVDKVLFVVIHLYFAILSKHFLIQVRLRKVEGDAASEKAENFDAKNIPRFRPFGILEPLPAKEARKSMFTALQVKAIPPILHWTAMTSSSFLGAHRVL
ncbi:hypothetical protein Y032_0333g2808 [Ancylostoma ceylanicum]|uniref:Uncharacterized protein n=1 Tax=Ancylostoma ceylanicum TaxID=53326 RepID=A0A016RZT1_9BILA|nr:hypothetical protein Y032_0333g2808 [Ancylostoma ceylanicum]